MKEGRKGSKGREGRKGATNMALKNRWHRKEECRTGKKRTEEGKKEMERKRKGRKKSEKYWGQRQNGWAGAVMVGRGGNSGW